ncbi:hypothetical protein [Breoghania sp.]|uniref:hypothetical protein n=1 Tax=Breoghania sp. TaxID=2065378 RepID=UPI00260382CD|nr:hypothetical protein [Breoghania sp.]MDJ0933375.1 hypothetical protein [Breoghania sp.]
MRTGIELIRGYEQKLLDDLFPWRDSSRVRAVRHTEVVSAALQYFLLDPGSAGAAPACAVSFRRSLGLVMREAVELAGHAMDKPAKGLSLKVPYLNWVSFGEVEWLYSKLDYIRGERAPDLRQQESRRKQADDKHVKLVRELAEEYFCNTERGRARQTVIEGDCKAIIEGRYYSLTLASHQEHSVAAAEARGETTVNAEKVVRDTLRIFLGVPEKIRELWQRDFAILRQISDAGNDALPDIREQGMLADIVTEEEPFGFILLQNEGHEINDSVRTYFRAPENRSWVVHEVGRMVQALVDLQKQGIVHRLINRSTLRWGESGRQVRLRLGGFELVTSAYTHDCLREDEDEASQIKKITAQRLADLVGMKRNRIFCESATQYFFCADDDGGMASGEVEKTSYMPQTAVFALCMILCDLFLGPPREADIKAFEAADNGHEVAEVLRILLQNYKADIVAATSDIVTPTLRDILLSDLEPDTASRPTAIDLSAEIVLKAHEL